MTTTKPHWIKNGYPDYQDLVESGGFQIMLWEESGHYQGDFFTVVKDKNGRYGYCVIGFGSCTGCDALDAAMPLDYDQADADWSDIVILRASIIEDFKFFTSKEDLASFIEDSLRVNNGNNWYWLHDESREILSRFILILRGEYPND